MSPLEAKLREFAPRKDFVIDTGTLLIHAMGGFDGGRHLPSTCDFVKESNKTEISRQIFELVNRLMTSASLSFVTPHVLTEFFALVEGRAKIKGRDIERFVANYHEVLRRLVDAAVPKNQVLSDENFSRFGIADTANIIASDLESAIILTTDMRLVQWCRAKGRPALHVYYDLYLLS